MHDSDISLKVYSNESLVYSDTFTTSVVLGRQDKGEPPPYRYCDLERGRKLVIAPNSETSVSREQALLELLNSRIVRIANLSANVPIRLDDGRVCQPVGKGDDSVCDAPLPVVFVVGRLSVRIEAASDELLLTSPSDLRSLAQPTLAPGQFRPNVRALADLLSEDREISAESLMQWLLDTMTVFQHETSVEDFFVLATKSLVDMVGLDFGAAMLWKDEQWVKAVSFGESAMKPSRAILERVRQDRRSLMFSPSGDESSLGGVLSVVAAPILDLDGNVLGVLYGDRRYSEDKQQLEITELEAMVVELVASGAANGLARLEHEEAALKARIQFEQFFTPVLARELEANPQLLSGREADVTILFCDIRGFSEVSHRIGPQQTMSWINYVLESLSECVVEQDGVLVDYVGDELIAMWGALQPCADHAERACRAALGMRKRLKEIDAQWLSTIERPTRVGIGINTGLAYVGNTGSNRKFKYGPLGNTVNLASRVQSASKMVKCDVVITDSTFRQLPQNFGSRRICKVQVVNIPTPVDLYELNEGPDQRWAELAKAYESALESFDQQQFREAVDTLGQLLRSFPDDGPTLILLSRVVEAMMHGCPESHPVWEFDRK